MATNVKELMVELAAELEAERQEKKAAEGSVRNGSTRQVQTVEWYAQQDAAELKRLKNNWASAKTNAKKNDKPADFETAVGEIEKINQVMGKGSRSPQRSEIYTIAGVDLTAKDADGNYVIDDKKLTALIKVAQSHKCMAKKANETDRVNEVLKIEKQLAAERTRRNPGGPSSTTRMKTKAEVALLMEQLEVVANDTDDEELLNEVQLRIETLQWVIGTLE